MSSLEDVKVAYQKFLSRGGSPSLIAKSSPDAEGREIYHLVRNIEFFKDGHRARLSDKFAVVGIPVKAKKLQNKQKFEELKAQLDEFVEQGGNVELLGKKDKLYRNIKNFRMRGKDGRMFSLEEKFAALGHPREAQISQNSQQDLTLAVTKFLQNGGDIYMPKARLPFYRQEYAVYAKSQRKKGVVGDLAFQTNMRGIGVPYSEMYFQYGKVERLRYFKDENGFVDSYRKHTEMNNFVKTSAYKLGLPIPVFVGLVGNCDLKGCYLDAEYFGYVREELADYLRLNDDFVGISKKNKSLYEKIKHIASFTMTFDGAKLSTSDVVSLLGFAEVENDFEKSDIAGQKDCDVRATLENLMNIARAKGGVLKRSDIPNEAYRLLIEKIATTGATTKAFFNLYGIDYVDGKTYDRLGRVYVEQFPCLAEMRTERDRIMAEKGVSIGGKSTKEEIFDALIDASVQAYDKFKSQIFNFTEQCIQSQSEVLPEEIEWETSNKTSDRSDKML